MVFSSIVFLLYFLPVFLISYALVPKKFKNFLILISSIIFYSWGAPKFIFVILGTTLVDFYVVRMMAKHEKKSLRRLFLILSVCLNVGLLFYFKYCNFFIDNINYILALGGIEPIKWLDVVLPIGISFYTFETITYVVDVYRRVHKPLSNFWEYQLYIILFPKLIAGPIIRYHDLADQIKNRYDNENNQARLTGIYRFIIGLSKKVLIANPLGQQADIIMSVQPDQLDTLSSWIGILAYTFQIYFDFSGYSDMALGLGKFMGFKFPENFNNPYNATSITDFWRRWHMTLGAWMKNYLYIPLGGNRVSKFRNYFNLWIVFLASGFWHGASWNFIIWGAYHGLFLVLERLFLLKIYEKIPTVFIVLLNFTVVAIGWVFFRVESTTSAMEFLVKMFTISNTHMPEVIPGLFFYMILAAIFSFICLFDWGSKIQNMIYFNQYSLKKHIIAFPVLVILLIINIASIAGMGFNPFIYFRF